MTARRGRPVEGGWGRPRAVAARGAGPRARALAARAADEPGHADVVAGSAATDRSHSDHDADAWTPRPARAPARPDGDRPAETPGEAR